MDQRGTTPRRRPTGRVQRRAPRRHLEKGQGSGRDECQRAGQRARRPRRRRQQGMGMDRKRGLTGRRAVVRPEADQRESQLGGCRSGLGRRKEEPGTREGVDGNEEMGRGTTDLLTNSYSNHDGFFILPYWDGWVDGWMLDGWSLCYHSLLLLLNTTTLLLLLLLRAHHQIHANEENEK